ncbi:thiol reductant ABC exporter subunit CydC [Nocardia yunnanensis]|uniref:Thiol reductant ABC exporter subunit CydC n=2 Tax=Nocardia yunnanensis TaxID=2382165 RepID=A0A386ZRX4_9NOCA|nr:thiol reductant ABC exporter subunit CydC [Nocardia yunnanensis]
MFAPHRGRVVLATLAALAAEAAALALLATAGWLIARAGDHPPLAAVAVALVAVRALALGRGVFRYAERLLGHDSALAVVTDLRTAVYRGLEPLAPEGVAGFRGGDLLTRLVEDVDAVQDLFLRCLLPATVAAGIAVAAVGFTATLSLPAAAVLSAGLVIAGVLVPCAVAAATARTSTAPDGRGELAARTVDLIEGAADLAAYNATGTAVSAARALERELARRQRRTARTSALATAAVLAAQGATALGITAIGLRTPLTTVTTTLLVVLALAVFESFAPLPDSARRLVEVRASARRLSTILTAAPPVREPTRDAPPLTSRRPLIEIRGLRVPGRLDEPLDLRLEPGRRIALTGPSGAGKSTVLAVLLRFVAYEGSVRVDGRELSTLPGDDVRRLVTGMTQDAHVFHATLRENLRFARPDATLEELRAAARRARLLDWIESLPQGWDTLVGAGGTGMSGGQRQRLLLARALLADPPVLLLDEPTEGLDPDTAADLLADLLDLTRARTTLMVSHSPAAMAAADEICSVAG